MSDRSLLSRIGLSMIRRGLLLGGILGAIGSIALGLFLSYRESERQSLRDLEGGLRFWNKGCELVFGMAQTELDGLARTLPGKSIEEIQAALRQASFDHPIFREAGWLRDGALVCNSYEVFDPPKPASPEVLRTSATPGGMYIIPPTETVLGGPSLIINRKLDEHTILDILIAPNSLLIPLRQATGSTSMAVFLMRDDGVVLLASEGAEKVGKAPGKIPPVGASRSAEGLALCQEVEAGHLFVVAVMPKGVLLAHWKEQWPVYGVLSVGAATIFLLGAWQLSRRFLGLRAELREAIGLGQFRPFFQPVVRLSDGKCEGAEILIRWIHPSRGTVPPGLFVPEAEAASLIGELTLAMIEPEAEGIRGLLRSHPGIHLNLNLATVMLDDDGFLQRLIRCVGDESLIPRFHFELTESTSAGEKAQRRLSEFKKLGIRLAVDDFGTGYSNLRYLKEFPFDYLKIDKAFVDGISSSTESSGLIDSIVGIGQNCGLHLIAEGIENEEQAKYLRQAGVQSGQGFFFSRPVALGEFVAWLEKRN